MSKKKQSSGKNTRNPKSPKKSAITAPYRRYTVSRHKINNSQFDERLTLQKSGRSSNSIYDRGNKQNWVQASRKIKKDKPKVQSKGKMQKNKLWDLQLPIYTSSRNKSTTFLKRELRKSKNNDSEYILSEDLESIESVIQPQHPKSVTKKQSLFDVQEDKLSFPFIQNNNTNFNFIVNANLNNDCFGESERERPENSLSKLFFESLKNNNKSSFFLPSEQQRSDLLYPKLGNSFSQIFPF